MNGGAPQSGRKAQEKTQLISTHCCAGLVGLQRGGSGRRYPLRAHRVHGAGAMEPVSIEFGGTRGHSFLGFVQKTAALHPVAPLHSSP